MESLEQPFNLLLSHFVDSNKRLFWLYVLSSVVLLSIYVWRSQAIRKQLVQQCSKRTWWHSSAQQDYLVWLINIVIKWLLITPFLFNAAPIAIKISFALENWFGSVYPIIPITYIPIAFTLMLFVLDDFSRFLLHYLSHRLPLLWRFHQVHHSAQVLTPVTVYRIHPIESLLYACRLVLTQGIALGVGFYLFGFRLEVIDVLGANLFVFIFNVFGANLRHSHLYISWGKRLENWLISPAQHQIHHSTAKQHYDKNFGSALAIWDRAFGTLQRATDTQQPSRFGLNNNKLTSVKKLYLQPFLRNK